MARAWQGRLTVFAGLHEKPQVRRIAGCTGLLGTDVVGRLLLVWLEFQTKADETGFLAGKTSAWLDMVAGAAGFAAAMEQAGWLEISHQGLRVAGFHEFISKRAVKRAEDAWKKWCERDAGSPGRADHNADIPRHTATYGDILPVEAVEPVGPPVEPAPAVDQDKLFERFWAAYPRHTAKAVARKRWQAAKVDEALLAVMLAALEAQKDTEQWRRGIIPHPSTWLNQRRWQDEPETTGGGCVPGRSRVVAKPGEYGNKPSYEPTSGIDDLPGNGGSLFDP